MPSTQSQDAMNTDREWHVVKSRWKVVREYLENKKDQIYEEMVHYPSPIHACDQHFNYLLEERTGVSQELRRLNAFSERSLTSKDPVKLIDEFITSSTVINDEAEQRIRSSFKDALSE